MFSFSLNSFEKKEVLDLGKIREVIVIGSGIAGITATIYAKRYGLDVILIGEKLGGLINDAYLVENFPGFLGSGKELVEKWKYHLTKLECDFVREKVIRIKKENSLFKVELSSGKEIKGRVIILATGSSKRKLGIDGEEKFKGKGISYCVSCDAYFFKNKKVAVVGGGNSAFSDALFLSNVAKEVLILVRNQVKAEKFLVDLVKKIDNIKVFEGVEIKRLEGINKLEKLVLFDKHTKEEKVLEIDGVFVSIGLEPNNELAKQLGIELDNQGFIKVKEDQSTNIERVFAAGDITTNSNKLNQLITAAAEGAIAANSVFKYLQKTKS